MSEQEKRVEVEEPFVIYVCPECGSRALGGGRNGRVVAHCRHCDDWGEARKVRREPVEVIPTPALSALIEKLEKRAERYDEIGDEEKIGYLATGNFGEASGLREAASDLRQLLDPTEGSSDDSNSK